jgi:GH25 family lysozyme M1 (1,4-beta-N-acetylmuramidase)
MAVYKYGDKTQISAHFKACEFQCKCSGEHDFPLDTALVEKLEKLHSALNCSAINVSSGFRCLAHDKAVGGSGTGQHIHGKAADICCIGQDGKPIDNRLVCIAAQDIGFTGIARIAGNGTFTHVDTRSGKWYGDETRGMNYCIPCKDFREYFGMGKAEEPMKKGVDISYCQKKIDWNKVDAEFVIVRAGYGRYTSQKDAMFEDHYKNAKERGIPVGAYWYSYAKSPDEARLEADACLAILAGKQFEYPIYYDVEEKDQLALGKEKLSAIMRAFLERVEAAGYFVGLYGSYSSLTNLTDASIRQRYAVWLAHWDVDKSPYTGAYGMWQYSVGSANGVTGACDLDYCYVDYPAKIKAKGLNGYGKQPDKPPEKPDTDSGIAVEMTIDGKQYKGTVYPK